MTPSKAILALLCLLGTLSCTKPATVAPADAGVPSQAPPAVTKDDCRDVALSYERGIDRDIDLAVAYQLHERCGELRMRGVPSADAKVAVEAFTRGCDLGSAEACVQLGQSARMGMGLKQDPAVATGHYQKACDLGHPAGCARLGLASRGDEAKGIALLDKALTLGRDLCQNDKKALHCTGSAKLAEKKHPALSKRLAEIGFELRREACTKGKDATACYELGLHYERGDVHQVSIRAAADLFKVACERKHADACRRARRLQRAQEKVTPVSKQATACRVAKGRDKACRELVEMCIEGNDVACQAATQVNLSFCTKTEKIGCLPVEVLCAKKPDAATCGPLLKVYGDLCAGGSGQHCTTLKGYCKDHPQTPGCDEQLKRVK
jgi:TPR repeat protein